MFRVEFCYAKGAVCHHISCTIHQSGAGNWCPPPPKSDAGLIATRPKVIATKLDFL
jgi:hypothetical protein